LLLKAKITNVEEWKAILTAIHEIVEDAMFLCTDDGIIFRGMDPSHVSLLDITFPKSSFEELESTTSFFGVRTEDFKNIFAAANNNDTLELRIENKDKLQILINGNLSMTFTLNLLDISEVNTPVPKLNSKSKMGLTSIALTKIVTNLEKISDNITVKSFSDRVEFSGRGDSGEIKIDLLTSSPDLETISSDEESTSVYSLEYMAKIVRSIGRASKAVNMEYSSKCPMHIEFDMPSNAKVNYYLAPKMAN